MENDFIYKVEGGFPSKEHATYAVRYTKSGYPLGWAKPKGMTEFETDFLVNNTGYEVVLAGIEVTKEEYDNF